MVERKTGIKCFKNAQKSRLTINRTALLSSNVIVRKINVIYTSTVMHESIITEYKLFLRAEVFRHRISELFVDQC